MLTELNFSLNNFPQGVSHLQEAVKIDSSYAVHWESIGDHLQQAGNPNDAILAYEQCLMTNSNNLTLLKKIGESYLSVGQLEAAHEALSQLKDHLNTQTQI